MKTNFYVLILLLAAASVLAQTNNLTSLLQQGLLEEQANGNLNAAIANYQSLAGAFDKDRPLAATAVFRLGECYRAQGETNEAIAQFQRILRDFSDQETLAKMSRQNLTGLGASSADAQPIANSDAKLWETVKNLPASQLEKVLPTLVSDSALASLVEQKSATEIKLAELGKVYKPPAMRDQKAVLNTVSEQIAERIDGIMQALKLRAEMSRTSVASAVAASPNEAVPDEDQAIQRIQHMIENSPDLINNGQLGKAAGSGHLRIATFLLDHGVDVNGKHDGNPPLAIAAMDAQKAMVELLLSRGADLEARDTSGATALFRATEGGYLAVVELLVAHKADVNARNSPANQENTPLHMAVVRGYVNVIKVLLAAGANPNLENSEGRTPLSDAAEHGHVEVVKMLLAAKADPNGGKMDAPLFSAIEKQDSASAQLLLEAGANPNKSGNINFRVTVGGNEYVGRPVSVTPLFFAVATTQLDMVRLLLKFKADPNDAQTEKRSLLFPALSDTNILETLLDAGAKIDALERVKLNDRLVERTPLDAAANRSLADAARILLKHGANPNARQDAGETALHWATWWPADAGVFKLLLENNANPNVRDDSGRTPLDILKDKLPRQNVTGVAELIELLRQHGALDNVPDWDRIQIIPASTHVAVTVFQKSTNDWNRFTLLDAILHYFGTGPHHLPGQLVFTPNSGPDAYRPPPPWRNQAAPMPFPDLTRVVIIRPSHGSTNLTRIALNLLDATNGVDCSKDVPLEFGDMVEIGQLDHPLGANPWWLSDRQVSDMINHLHGTAQLVVRRQKVKLPLDPGEASTIGAVLHQTAAQQVLLASSDLSRVKVTRPDSKTGKASEWILDCSTSQWPDLWLRDGDAVEVPEKP